MIIEFSEKTAIAIYRTIKLTLKYAKRKGLEEM